MATIGIPAWLNEGGPMPRSSFTNSQPRVSVRHSGLLRPAALLWRTWNPGENMAEINGFLTMSLFASLIPGRFMRPPPERRAFSRLAPDTSWTASGEIDQFRAYADIYGRRVCEEAVSRIRDALWLEARGRARIQWHGGAFVALLAGGSLEGAMALADDFRAAVEALQIAHQASPLGVVTVSLGIAPLAGEDEDSRTEALSRARDALERAQMSGLNHVLAAGLALA